MKSLPGSKSSIALKMLKIVFSIYMLVAISATLIQMGVEYYTAKKNFSIELDSYRKMFALDLSAALWNFDMDSIIRISAGIMEIPVIDGVVIRDSNGKSIIHKVGLFNGNLMDNSGKSDYVKSGVSFDLDSHWYEFPIVYKFKKNPISVGTLIIHSPPGIIFKRLKPGFATLIINSVIKSLALFVIFLSVGKFVLSKPLSILITSLNELDLEDLKVYRSINIRSAENNEFKLIEDAFNGMLKRLMFSTNRLMDLQRELQFSNEILEIKIAERTRELCEKNRLLEGLSKTDPLTSVANRRSFDDILEHEYSRLGRVSTHLSIVLCDIDCFKTYNDLYGHQAGDECLKSVANQLKEGAKRKNDCVARYGGEEFALILPDTNLMDAVAMAETIRASIEDLGIEHKKEIKPGVVTISMGVACAETPIDEKGCCYTSLIKKADEALYLAKESGRNRVVFKK